MRRSVIHFVIGIVLALSAVFLMSQYKGTYDVVAAPGKPQIDVVKIIVANKDLPFGSTLMLDYLEYVSWPKDSVPVGVFTDMDKLLNSKEGKKGGRVVIRPIFEGEPILEKKVSGFGDKPTLSRKVAQDKRAFSISINDVSGVAGFLLPGDHVDIMLTRMASDKDNKLVTDVILQNIIILGIDQLTDEGIETPVIARTATVEVDPVEAQKLALAQQVGTLSLSLRHHDNQAESAVATVSINDLSGATVVVKSKGSTKKKVMGHFVNVRRGTVLDHTRVPR